HPLLWQRDAGDARPILGAQHAALRGDAEEPARAVAKALRRSRQVQRGHLEAVHELPRPGDAKPGFSLPRTESKRVPPNAGAVAEADAHDVLRFWFLRVPGHAGIRRAIRGRSAARRQESVRRGKQNLISRRRTEAAPKVGFVSLGCPKALVD